MCSRPKPRHPRRAGPPKSCCTSAIEPSAISAARGRCAFALKVSRAACVWALPTCGLKARSPKAWRVTLPPGPKGERGARLGLPAQRPCCLPAPADASAHAARAQERGQAAATGGRAAHRPRLVAVVLDPCCTQTGQAVPIDRALPRQKFVDRQLVAFTRFLEAQQAAAHGGHNFSLAPNDPALGVLWRQIGHGERTAVRPDDVAHPRPVLLIGHDTRYTLSDLGKILDQRD